VAIIDWLLSVMSSLVAPPHWSITNLFFFFFFCWEILAFSAHLLLLPVTGFFSPQFCDVAKLAIIHFKI
jgi:hypothetical protein